MVPLALAILVGISSAGSQAEHRDPLLSPPIVVIAPTEEELAAAVEDCRRSPCPVRQDVIASARYAEYLLRKGDYRASRATLMAAASRLRGRAGEDPLAVAQLNNALGTVADHYGDLEQRRQALGSSIRILREHGAAPGQVLRARLNLIYAQMPERHHVVSDRAYAILAEEAVAAGEDAIAAEAVVLRATIARARRDRDAANDLIAQALALPAIDPALARSANILLARWAVEDGRMTLAEAQQLAGENTGEEIPISLVTPVAHRAQTAAEEARAATGVDHVTRSSDLARLQWADVAYDVLPSGEVANVRVVRGSSGTRWLDATLATLAARRFAPHSGSGPLSRLERYTLSGRFGTPIGSLIRRRLPSSRIVRLDLTPR